MAHQHILGYLMPYNGVKNVTKMRNVNCTGQIKKIPSTFVDISAVHANF